MGDRLATINIDRNVVAAVPLSVGGPHLAQCGLSYVPSGILIHPAATDMGRKLGELGPHVTQCGLG